ncbi:MAG: gamma-glutamyl-gamma-aminobutyrate hydrolase family protein [Hydrogenophaga sp.]|jgi:putative glutamine amidotransferase|uniref:gamma-glutamyl-gamma-aminobutyrate hydrolase family protein n=1 Tax=Hydrogenophaga sp. TaxID=1904254 RepID=UPI001D4337AD|nr:type 1 glutamine amidotransferase [Hydrogenophaga sp.]MBW0170186.1 type 1 glutamine amidotransferase [Hydrogenophaga sp.]MBW0184431.1 type 1 glutamine amidotransferase [Hydrogenophaga sp.]
MPIDRALRIGVSARLLHQAPQELGFRNKILQYIEQSLAHWIMEHGAVAFMVPAVAHDSKHAARHLKVEQVVQELDALVLQGGADVAPQTYGQTPMDPRWQGDVVRDRYELALLRTFLAQKKPVLGVCRGAQLLNVAFGGTLYQDIPTQCPAAHAHVDTDLYDQLEHDVTFLQGTALTKLYPNASQLRVTSIHHQAVAQLGKGVVVEAVSTLDGMVEAIRWTGDTYARGVQWHPEFHHGRDALADSSPIMLDFLEASRAAAMERLTRGLEPDPRVPRPPLRLASE